MGNKLVSIPTSSAIVFIQDHLDEFTTEEARGCGRYLRTILARHDEGRVAIKVFFRGTWSASSSEHTAELEKILLNLQRLSHLRDAFSQIPFPHVWPYQSCRTTERAVFVIRQWHSRTLSERIGTRPFLTDMEKLWVFYQLLQALCQCHAAGFSHGDIKSDNVLVTSGGWVYLADFAFHKPTTIAENDPAGFSYFFDSNGLRTCYLAPERFVHTDILSPPPTPEPSASPYSPLAPRVSRLTNAVLDASMLADNLASLPLNPTAPSPTSPRGFAAPTNLPSSASTPSASVPSASAHPQHHLLHSSSSSSIPSSIPSSFTSPSSSSSSSSSASSSLLFSSSSSSSFFPTSSSSSTTSSTTSTSTTTPQQQQQEVAFLTPAMDVYALGCLIIELFLDGENFMSFENALKYRRNRALFQAEVLSRIANPHLRAILDRMTSVEPQLRPSASSLLEAPIFPRVFIDFRVYLGTLLPLSPDAAVAAIVADWPLLTDAYPRWACASPHATRDHAQRYQHCPLFASNKPSSAHAALQLDSVAVARRDAPLPAQPHLPFYDLPSAARDAAALLGPDPRDAVSAELLHGLSMDQLLAETEALIDRSATAVREIDWQLDRSPGPDMTSSDLLKILITGRAPDLQLSLRKHLELKFCAENFDFLLAIFDYQQAPTHQRLRLGRKLYYQYLDSSAPHQVFVGSDIGFSLNDIKAVLDDQRAPKTLFDGLFHQVFRELVFSSSYFQWNSVHFPNLTTAPSTRHQSHLPFPQDASAPMPPAPEASGQASPLSSPAQSPASSPHLPPPPPLGMGRTYLPPLPSPAAAAAAPPSLSPPPLAESESDLPMDPTHPSIPPHFAELLLSFVLSRIRAVHDPSVRCQALELLHKLAACLNDKFRLQRILPYMLTLISSTEHRSVASLAISLLPELLSLVQRLEVSHSEIFADYIFPCLSSILSSSDDLILRTYAARVSKFARLSVAFLEAAGRDPKSDVPFDTQLSHLRDIVFDHIIRLLGSPHSSSTAKRYILQDLYALCRFFGVERAANQFLPTIIFEMLANKNNDCWELRAEFFKRIVPIARNLFDPFAFFSLLYPTLITALTDDEGFVVEEVLKSIGTLADSKYFSRAHLIELMTRTIPFVVHPNTWIKNAAISCIYSLSRQFPLADRPLIISPLLSPYAVDTTHIFHSVEQLAEDIRPPLSQEVFDSLVKIAYICQHFSPEGNELSADSESSNFFDSFISLILDSGKFADDQIPLFQAMSRLFGSLAARTSYSDVEIESFIGAFNFVPSPAFQHRTLATAHSHSPISRVGTPVTLRANSIDNYANVLGANVSPPAVRHSSGLIEPRDMRATEHAHDSGSYPMAEEITNLPHIKPRRLRTQIWTRFFASSARLATQDRKPNVLEDPNFEFTHLSIDQSRPVAYAMLDTRKGKFVLTPPTASQRAKAPEAYPPEESFFHQFDMSLSSQPRETRAPKEHAFEHALSRAGLVSTPGHPVASNPRRKKQRRFQGTVDEELNDLYALLPKKPVGTSKLKNWIPQGKLLFDLPQAHQVSISAVRCAPDHSFVASCSIDGLVKLWDSQAFSPANKTSVLRESGIFVHGDGSFAINCLTFIENSRSIVTGSDSGTMQITRIDAYSEPLFEGSRHRKKTDAAPASGAAHTYRSTAVEHIDPFERLGLSRSPIVSIEHYNSHDRMQSLVFYGSAAGRIAAFDLRTGRDTWSLQNQSHLGPMTCFASPHTDKTLLVTGSSRGFYCIWDLRFRGCLKSWKHPERSEFPIRSIVPTHGDNFFAAVGPNQVWRWEIPSNTCNRIYRMRPSPRYSSRTRINTTVFPLTSKCPAPSLVDLFDSKADEGSEHLGSIHKSLTSIGEFSIPKVSSLHHPFNADFLITGSSDGTVRYWNDRDIAQSRQIYHHSSRNPPPKYLRLPSDPHSALHHEYFDEVELNEMDSFLYHHSEIKKKEEVSAHPDSITAIEILQNPQPILITTDRTGGMKVCV